MTTTTNTGIVVSYVLFISIMLFIAPFFAPDLFNVSKDKIDEISTSAEAPIFQAVLTFIAELITRFSILLSISTSGTIIGTIVGIFTGAYTIGFLWALLSLIAEALP